MSHYRHRQVGWIHRIVVPGFLGSAALVLLFWEDPRPAGLAILGVVGLILVLSALAFRHLDTEVTDRELRVAFGPLSLARKTVALTSIRTVRRGRSSILDGWGIHWRPGVGWIWNVAGRETVELLLEEGSFRVGTDDVAGLMDALERARAAD